MKCPNCEAEVREEDKFCGECGRALPRRGEIASKPKSLLDWTIWILLILWLLGIVSGITIGGLIYVLLVIAIIMILLRINQGRRPV